MAFWNDWLNTIASKIAAGIVEHSDMVQPLVQARAYRQGYARPQLKVKPNQFDDNLALNYTGLIANRIVSQMFGKGVTLDFEGETETEQEKYVNGVLDANKQELLFHRAALSACEAGTGYLFTIPESVVGKDGVVYPRLQLVDPLFVTMDTLPEDYEIVIRYTITYKFTDADGKEKARKRVIEHQAPEVLEDGAQQGGNTWTITDMVQQPGGRWEVVGTTPWPYPFPPIIHWQNLPSVSDCYGEPDISGSLIELQERTNFLASNISKIVRYYAHPMRYSKFAGSVKQTEAGPDQMLNFEHEQGGVYQLESLGDLASSMQFFSSLQKAMFDTTRVTDLSGHDDKLGALTNFGLRVLYQDNLSLIDTHRELFGDMLEELARRLQILAGMEPVPCKSVWPDFLPVNDAETQTALEGDLRMGIVSKETVSKERGYDWDEEQERIEGERESEDNIGGALLRAFNGGGGGFPTGNNNQNRSNQNA